VRVRDLSLDHQPLGALFPRPDPADFERARLSEDQIAFFQEQGYLAGIPILAAHEVDLLARELDELMHAPAATRALFYEYNTNESKDPATVLFHALGAWRAAPGFHDVLWHTRFVVPASQLLRGAVRFWHDQIFWKPPRQGGVVAWHQDYSYWTRTEPMAHLTCWIALEDATIDNGCLQYIPRSHRWNLLPNTGLAGRMNAIEEALTPEQRAQFTSVPIELRRGEATFHHPLMVHGSGQNRSGRPRPGAVLNVVRDGVRSASDAPLLEGVPPVPAGQPLSGQFFPLLYP
jgi:ectoine hydroxylase-related dioxygenase (phytanoyl-CoA dioxygenase family)